MCLKRLASSLISYIPYVVNTRVIYTIQSTVENVIKVN